MSLSTTIRELLVRTQQTQNQKTVQTLIADAIDELERRVKEIEEAIWPGDEENLDELPELTGSYFARKVGNQKRSTWFEIVDHDTGIVLDKIQGEDAAKAKLAELNS